MSSSDALTESVQQLLRRYRDRLIARTSLISLLSLTVLSALMWRLWLAKTPPALLLGIGLVGLLILARWQWFAWRRERLSTSTVALDVDRTLDLHARLITATELAGEPNPPMLYPRLLQETREALASASAQLPRVVDRRVVWLSAALLLLLLWRSHPAASLTQLAKHAPPQPPPEQPPPRSLDTPQDRAPSASRGAQPPEQQDASTQSSHDQQQQQQSNQGQGTDQSQPSQSSDSQQPQQPSPRHADQGKEVDQGQRADADASPQQGEAGKDRADDRRQPSADSSERHASDQKQATSKSQDRRQDGRQDQRAGRTGTSSTSERDGKAERQQSAGAPTQGAQQQMSEGQDALKGEIQQLLKQLSEELQSLQAHVAEQRLDRPPPAPGTSTDPQLYDDADVSSQADASKRRLPIQITVDQQMAASRRAAGGVGEPSDDVAAQTPQQLEEEAQLSTQAADAEAVTRPAIPPEYQPVFDRLSSQPQEPSQP